MTRRPELTPWQLRVLLEAAELATKAREGSQKPIGFSDVAARLEVSRQQVVGAIERLEKNVGVRLLEERDDGLFVARPDLIRTARKLLDEFEQFDREAREGTGRWWLRLDGYWAHLAAFLAEAATSVEEIHPEVRVELSPRFGEARSTGGAGLASHVEHGEIDLVVAPAGSPPSEHVRVAPTHKSILLAAIGPEHDLYTEAEAPVIEIGRMQVEGFPLLVSPKGHMSRDLLDRFQGAVGAYRVEVAGPEPAALVAFGGRRRVPVIASDSILPAGIPGANSDDPWSIPKHWPALVDRRGRLLGREYAIYHRQHLVKTRRGHVVRETRSVPPNVSEWLIELAEKSQVLAANRLISRTSQWGDRTLAN